MASYIWDMSASRWVAPHEYARPIRAAAEFPCPMVVRDIEPYASPIDGRMITSRSERREDLRKNGCVEIGEDRVKQVRDPKRALREYKLAKQRKS